MNNETIYHQFFSKGERFNNIKTFIIQRFGLFTKVSDVAINGFEMDTKRVSLGLSYNQGRLPAS